MLWSADPKPAVSGLLSGGSWDSPAVSFSFPSSGSSYGYGDTHGFQPFSEFQKDAARDILEKFAAVAGIKFNEAPDHRAALRFAESNAHDTAYAYFPGASERAGDMWFNSAKGWYDRPVAGDYAYFTIMHELGHALGLKHGHEASGGGTLPASHNGMPFSIMTYASYVGAAITGRYTNDWSSYAQTPMLDDVAALQHLYGANFHYNASDTTYVWNPQSGELAINGSGLGAPVTNRVFQTVWDGGGTDTYDLSGYTTDLLIDLRPGRWSNLSDQQLALLSPGSGIRAPGNVANAYLFKGDQRSLIENALGGSGNDTLFGNGANNTLSGGAGHDIMTGGKGSDTYITDGLDRISEQKGEGYDVVESSGNITLAANLESLILTGTSGLRGFGNSSANAIYGTAQGDLIFGGGGKDTLSGGAGNDTYILGDHDTISEALSGGIDTVVSSFNLKAPRNTENIVLAGTKAKFAIGNWNANVLSGNSAANTLSGEGGDDILVGRTGADKLLGGAGSDRLIGGEGVDLLVGGAGRDTFVFESLEERGDRIADFVSGTDKLMFSRTLFSGHLFSAHQHFGISSAVAQQEPILVFDVNRGVLSFDIDGTGEARAVVLAYLTNATKLLASDVVFV